MASNINDTGILLESGTNEFEVLVFKLGSDSYGVNVAKVREIITPTQVTKCPDQPKAMLGMINLRGRTLPLVGLHHYFDVMPKQVDASKHCVIVTEFSDARCAFLVEGVEQIFRASWSMIQPMPDVSQWEHSQVTGILNLNNRLIPMIDFESIYASMFCREQGNDRVAETEYQVDRAAHRLMIADDSPVIRKTIATTLRNSGYTNVLVYPNGFDLWTQLEHDLKSEVVPDVVITDIEMPLMDGLALTRNIRKEELCNDVPVILFSSLVSDDNQKKGEQVGASEQLAKPQFTKLVELCDKWIALKMDKRIRRAA